jgi:hypothetical protein
MPIRLYAGLRALPWLPSSLELVVLSFSSSIYVDNYFQMLDVLYQEARMKHNSMYTYLGLEPLYF